MKNTLLFLFTFLVCNSALRPQETDELSTCIKLWNDEQIDELEALIPKLKSKFPDKPESVFLQAVFETDGDAAAETYEKLLVKYPDHLFADACLFRLIQFDYARAAYETAGQRAQVLKNEFPKSPYVGRTESMFAGLSAEVKLTDAETLPVKPSGKYRLQVGAFGQLKNAEELRDKLKAGGYNVEFSEKTVNNQKLTLVWVGPYATRDDASKEGAELKNKFQLTFTIVEK